METSLNKSALLNLPKKIQKIDDLTLLLCYAFYTLTILLNFIGSPLVKYIYYLQTLFTLWVCYRGPLSRSIVPIFMYLLVEGQGRIITEYAQWTRISIDLCLLATILREIISRKLLFPIKNVPIVIVAPIILHFIWYFVQFFNPHSPSILMQLIAFKMYIFPVFYFLFLSTDNNSFNEKTLQNLSYFILFASITQCLLTLYQFNMGEQFLYSISNYYKKTFAEETGKFTGLNFRPPGMTFAAGGFAIYLYLVLSLYFVTPLKKWVKLYLLPLTVLLNFTILFISQSRSVTIRYTLTLFLIGLSTFLINRRKGRILTWGLIISFVAFLVFSQLNISSNFIRSNNLISSFDRMMTISNIVDEDFLKKNRRMDFSRFWDVSTEKLQELPIGLGPGRTGPPGSFFIDELAKDNFYGINYNTFHNESFYYSTILELGYGAIGFFSLIFAIPLFCLPYFFRFLVAGDLINSRKVIISIIITSVTIIGNWTANGLTYIPEAFLFWYYGAMGVNTVLEHKKNQAASLPDLSASSEESSSSTSGLSSPS